MSFRDLLQSGATQAKLSSWESSVKQIQRHRPKRTLRMSDNIEKLWLAKHSSSRVFFLCSSWVVRIRGGTRALFINTAAWQVESRAGLRNLLCSAGNFGRMGSVGGQHEVQYTEWGMDKFTYNCMCKFTWVFFYIAALLVGQSRDRFSVVSLGIFSVVPPTEPCALRSTQPLKVSTRDFSWGKGGRCVWLTTYHSCSAETSR